MKRKRIITLLLCLLLLLLLIACTYEPTEQNGLKNNYEVYRASGGAARSYFSDDVGRARGLYPDTTEQKPNDKIRTVQVNGVSYELNYSKTLSALGGCGHVYETSDGTVRFSYRAEDMALSALGIDMALVDFADMGQAQYEQWIQTFVSQFVQEDWSKLKLVCQTQYGGLTVDGFTSETKGDKIPLAYRFRYSRYIGSIKTTDCLSATFAIDAEANIMRISINFSDHRFDSLENFTIDEIRVEQAIQDCIEGHKAENVTLDSWKTVGEDELIMVNGNIMLSRSVFIAYKWNGIEYDSEYGLYIDIPDP